VSKRRDNRNEFEGDNFDTSGYGNFPVDFDDSWRRVDLKRQAKHNIPNSKNSYFVGNNLQELIYLYGSTEIQTEDGGKTYTEYIDMPDGEYVGVYVDKQGNPHLSSQFEVVYDANGAHGWPTKKGVKW
jgi:hypothetical protein